jgi:SSS family solute:Na+ symporter
VPESHWNLGPYGVSGTVYWILLYVPGLVIGQDIWQRMFTARTPSIARAGTLSAGAYTIVYSLAAVVLGMSVRATGIQLDDPSMAFEAGVSAFYSSTAMESLERLSCENIVHFLRGEKDRVFKLVN